jgi:hypothetical protein
MALSFGMHLALFCFVQFGGSAVARASEDAPPTTGVVAVLLGAAGSTKTLGKPAVVLPDRSAAANDGPPVIIRTPAKPYYFQAAELTQKPLVLRDVPSDLLFDVPDVPPHAAVLRLLINELGEVDEVIIDDSSVPEAVAQSIIEAFRKARFHAGEIDGTPVKSQVRIEVMLEKPLS